MAKGNKGASHPGASPDPAAEAQELQMRFGGFPFSETRLRLVKPAGYAPPMCTNRLFIVMLTGTLCLLAGASPSQESSESIAARQAMQENMRTLSARIEDLEIANQSLRARVDDLRRELQQLREETRKLADQSGTQEQLRRLGDSIREVDTKRRADNDKVLAELARLAKQITDTPVAPPPPVVKHPPADPEPKSPNRPPIPEKGIEYVVKSGDTLSGIVTACRAKEIKITLKQMRDANPEVNWDKLRVGQKLFIPLP